MNVLYELLNNSCADTACEVIEQETLRSPYLFEYTAEHPYCKHIEEQMGKSAVHEHVSNQLRCVKISGKEEMQA